jgi:Anti-sigma factor NepR
LVPYKLQQYGNQQMYGEMTADRGKSKLQHEIDQNLKRVYDEALNEEIPDRFKKLLEQLKNREAKQ